MGHEEIEGVNRVFVLNGEMGGGRNHQETCNSAFSLGSKKNDEVCLQAMEWSSLRDKQTTHIHCVLATLLFVKNCNQAAFLRRKALGPRSEGAGFVV